MTSHAASAGRCPQAVSVVTGARLHFGLLTHRPASGRESGGIGVMIDQPGWRLLMENISGPHGNTGNSGESISTRNGDASTTGDVVQFSIEPSGDHTPDLNRLKSRILDTLQRCQTSVSTHAARDDMQVSRVQVTIRSVIPSHRGLGSGTQLALAIAQGLNRLCGRREISADHLAQQSGRGLRSAVGTWGFQTGGLILDGGKRTPDSVGALVTQVPFPDDWRFVLVTPRRSQGLSGDHESQAFGQLGSMSTQATDRLCRIAVMDLIPAVRECAFDEFAVALGEYGRIVGEYFAPVQGGVYGDPSVSAVADHLSRSGITGIGQSSWGPTAAVACRDEAMARDVVRLIADVTTAVPCDTAIVSVTNHGAEIREQFDNRPSGQPAR